MKIMIPLMVLVTITCGNALHAQPLAVGDPAPHLAFTDIEGQKANTDEYQNWTIVYTFADRNNNKELTAWIERAGLELAKKHPELKIAYINFADVSSVPRVFRYIVEPILRHVHEKTTKRSKAFYEKEGIPRDAERHSFHLIPDWNGAYLKVFGIKDAAIYRCWIVVNDRVVATVDQSQQDIEKKFIEIFDTLEASHH